MEWYFILIVMVGFFIMLLFLGIPINYSFGLSFILVMVFFSGEPVSYVFDLFGLVIFRKLNNLVLVAIPLFILMGQLFSVSNVGFRMYEGFRRWLGWIPGGLAVATIMTNTLFAAICGGSMISSAATSPISIPSMRRFGYNIRLALGSECSGSALAMLIPPSIPGIFYCVITEQSIGRLFMAGIVPGFLSSVLFMVMIVIRAKLNPGLAPKAGEVTWKERRQSMSWVGGPGFLVVIILVSLYSGMIGINEIAAIAVIGSTALVLAYRELDWQHVRLSMLRTMRIGGFFVMIYVCATFMGFGFAFFGISEAFSNWVASLPFPNIVILLIILIMYFAIGMIMDASAVILVTMPVILPIILTLGYDPIWFGILLILNLEIGAITPPVGLNLFAIKAAVPDIDIRDAIFGSIPFIFVILFVMGLVIIFPSLALWLPSKMI